MKDRLCVRRRNCAIAEGCRPGFADIIVELTAMSPRGCSGASAAHQSGYQGDEENEQSEREPIQPSPPPGENLEHPCAHGSLPLEHDAEKCDAVFGRHHALSPSIAHLSTDACGHHEAIHKWLSAASPAIFAALRECTQKKSGSELVPQHASLAKNKLIQADRYINRRRFRRRPKSPEIRHFGPCRNGNGAIAAASFRPRTMAKPAFGGLSGAALTGCTAGGTPKPLVTP